VDSRPHEGESTSRSSAGSRLTFADVPLRTTSALRNLFLAVLALFLALPSGVFVSPLRWEIALGVAAWSVSGWLAVLVGATWFAARTVAHGQPFWDLFIAVVAVVAAHTIGMRYATRVERRRDVPLVAVQLFVVALVVQLLVMTRLDVIRDGELPRGAVGVVAMIALGLAVHWRPTADGRHPLATALVLLAIGCGSMVASAEILRYRDIDDLQLAVEQISRRFQEAHNSALELSSSTADLIAGSQISANDFAQRVGTVLTNDDTVAVAAVADESGTVLASVSNHGTAAEAAFSQWISTEHEMDHGDSADHSHGVGIDNFTFFVDLPGASGDLEPHIVHSVVVDDVELYVAHSIADLLAKASRRILADTGGAEVVLVGSEGEVWTQQALDESGAPVATVRSDPGVVTRADLTLHGEPYSVRLTPSIDFGMPHSTLQLLLLGQGFLGLVLYLAVGSAALVRVTTDRQRRRRESMLDAALRAADGWSAIVDADDVVGVTNGGPHGVASGARLSDIDLLRHDAEIHERVMTALARARLGDHVSLELSDRLDGRERFFELRVQRIPAAADLLFVQFVDVTAAREQALRTAQAERMESIGLLAGGLAHDFNNLMFISQGYLKKIEDHAGRLRDDTLRGYVSPVLDAVRRGADLTRALLTVSGKHPVNPVGIGIDRFIDELAPLISQSVPPHIAISYEIQPDLHVLADAGRLSNAMLNLCVNAGHAMEQLDRGQLVITARSGDEGMIDISVQDTGHGMSAEVRARAFEPFFTTKIRGKGTGLGLASVFSFVQQSEGQVSIDSVEGEGTTITMSLPAAGEVGDGLIPRDAGRALKVLVVDDEPALAELVRTPPRRRSRSPRSSIRNSSCPTPI